MKIIFLLDVFIKEVCIYKLFFLFCFFERERGYYLYLYEHKYKISSPLGIPNCIRSHACQLYTKDGYIYQIPPGRKIVLFPFLLSRQQLHSLCCTRDVDGLSGHDLQQSFAITTQNRNIWCQYAACGWPIYNKLRIDFQINIFIAQSPSQT